MVNFTSSADLSKFFYDTLGFVCYKYSIYKRVYRERQTELGDRAEANFQFYRNMGATSSLAQNLMVLTKSSRDTRS